MKRNGALMPGSTRVERKGNFAFYRLEKGRLIVEPYDDEVVFSANELKSYINLFNPTAIVISNIHSLFLLKDIIRQIDTIKLPVIIDLRNDIKDLNNQSILNIQMLPDNVKIIMSKTNREQTNIVTWAHNLSSEAKELLKTKLSSLDRYYFEEEEEIIRDIYVKLVRLYPNIDMLPLKEKFEKVFDYINEHYPYYGIALNGAGDDVVQGYEWTRDTVETYKRGKGVCVGRSSLLKLVTNNSLFNIPCYTVGGCRSGVGHQWNEILLDNGLYDYDLSFGGIKHMGRDDLLNRNYIINPYSIEEDIKVYLSKTLRIKIDNIKLLGTKMKLYDYLTYRKVLKR